MEIECPTNVQHLTDVTFIDSLTNLQKVYQELNYVQAKEADLLVQNKELYGDKEQLSQINEYGEISNLEEPKTSNQQNGISDNCSDAKSQDTADEIVNLESSFASFPTPSLQALKGCFDICEDDVATVSPAQLNNPLYSCQ
ncbi:hypothetical protein HanPI659440_Chr03g0104961 [Helianthus annuus]|nr:hypothetical protein HanPI659440_Chr03g0104961 [Helianthus annuus]